jgi:hypothetical protein
MGVAAGADVAAIASVGSVVGVVDPPQARATASNARMKIVKGRGKKWRFNLIPSLLLMTMLLA